jgi:hypothetical protein
MTGTDGKQEHRHSFVRKNAVFAVYSIYQDHEHLIPDAPELLDTFLAAVSLRSIRRPQLLIDFPGIRLYLQAQRFRHSLQHFSAHCCAVFVERDRSAAWNGRVDADGCD